MAEALDSRNGCDPNFPGPRRHRKALGISLTLVGLLTAAAVTAWKFPNIIYSHSISKNSQTPRPDPKLYSLLKEDLEIRRTRLGMKYKNALTDEQRDIILNEAQQLLDTVLPKMMCCWLGTPWNFHGTSDTPGNGNIACGYFVSTILRDAGFRVDRYILAQQPSQYILETFVDRSRRTVISGMSYDRFLETMAKKPAGIYIVGLDRHVGFIVNDDMGIRFIHSSGVTPRTVVDESSENAYSLQHSNYRVFGHITGEKDTLIGWLQTKSFKVKRS